MTRFRGVALVLGMLAYSHATPQTLSPCPEGAGACVRDVPALQTTLPDNLIIDADGMAYPAATVRELPQTTWGWENIYPQDTTSPPGPLGYPAAIAPTLACARTPDQALAWLSGAGGTKDDYLLNRALAAYDWAGQADGAVDARAQWLLAWPQGNWQQQVGYDAYNQNTAVQRYRFITQDEDVYTWVRAQRTMGCWTLRYSAPQHNTDEPAYTAPTESVQGQVEREGNLEILWESSD